MQRAVDRDNVALSQHLLQVCDSPAPNLLLLLRRQGLVVIVQQLLAVEPLQATEYTLADAADRDGTDYLVLEVELVLSGLGNVPPTLLDHLVGGHKVADKDEDSHDDVLGHGDNVGAGHLSDGDATVSLVGGVEVDMVGADTGRDSELKVLSLGEALGCEVAWVEAVVVVVS